MTRLELAGLVLELTPEQVEEAREQLGVSTPPEQTGPLDVHAVAKRIGRSRDFVYSHARELGGRKVGGVWVFGLDAAPVPAEPGAAQRPTRRRGQTRRKSPTRRRRLEVKEKSA